MSELRYKLEKISPYTVELGEGPHWDEISGKLYHVDLVKGGCYSLDPVTREYKSHYFKPALTLIVPIEGKPDEFIITQNQDICHLNWSTGDVKVISSAGESDKDTRVNDGKCDAAGRLWFGTMNWERRPGHFEKGLGSLYLMDGHSKVSHKLGELTISNGLAWSKDNKKFFFIDSMAKEVWVYDYDHPTGDISNRKTIFNIKGLEGFSDWEVPDGMTIDCYDKLWIAFFNGSKVVRVDPETGTILGTIKTPASKTTSATWGGPDFKTLYITSATYGLSEEQIKANPEAGGVFAVTFEQENISGFRNQPFTSKL